MSPAQTRTRVKRTSFLPDGFEFVDAQDVAERQRDEKHRGGADGDGGQDFEQRAASEEADGDAAENENQEGGVEREDAGGGVADDREAFAEGVSFDQALGILGVKNQARRRSKSIS